jgi:xylulokinase
MLLLGIDIGTSAIKVSIVDDQTTTCIFSVQFPETEMPIIVSQPGWAEQSPLQWWDDVKTAIAKAHASKKYDPKDIAAIGIAYQMHGLVLVDKDQNVLRNSIIWCDSRSVETGNKAWKAIGKEHCLRHLLNSPGNFTASKLGWVKENEPQIYKQVYKMMLPGDFIAMKLTGHITTTSSALSEGIFWDFTKNKVSREVLDYFRFDENIIPDIRPLFSVHGELKNEVAQELLLRQGIPVSYKAGDQLNNAFSLNVLQPGEAAATAGTSGVIYAVSSTLSADKLSRVNSFAHVNHSRDARRLGNLLCINGAGSMNSWVKNLCGQTNYTEMDRQAAQVQPGSDGLNVLPFGNGAERILQNKIIGAHILNIDLNKHNKAHLFRATQEGIAFAFRYGLDIMRENDLKPSVIRAGKTGMFLSDVFVESFVNATGVPVELYANDGSWGAALGAGVGAGIYKTYEEVFNNFKPLKRVEVNDIKLYDQLYTSWKAGLSGFLNEN